MRKKGKLHFVNPLASCLQSLAKNQVNLFKNTRFSLNHQKNQIPFWSKFSTVDYLQVINDLLEEMNEWNKSLYTPSTDCGKGLNLAERNLSWIPVDLKRQSMNDSYIQHLRNISITESTMFYLTVEKIKRGKCKVKIPHSHLLCSDWGGNGQGFNREAKTFFRSLEML